VGLQCSKLTAPFGLELGRVDVGSGRWRWWLAVVDAVFGESLGGMFGT
jgi:hypothetical protein